MITDQSKKLQLKREIDTMKSLFIEDHDACPFIVKLLDTIQNPRYSTLSLCLEYIDLGTLQNIVCKGGCKHETILASISFQMLSGLQYLHLKDTCDVQPGLQRVCRIVKR